MCCDYFSRHAFVILIAAIATAGKMIISMFLLTPKAHFTVSEDDVFAKIFLIFEINMV